MSNRKKVRNPVVRHIPRESSGLVKKLEKNPPKPKPAGIPEEIRRYNGYRCEACRGRWLTVDLNEGVTPMFSPCFATEGCRGRAVSLGYPPGPPPGDMPLLIEWYAPANTRGLSYEAKDHVNKGGLIRRATEQAPDWVKAIV